MPSEDMGAAPSQMTGREGAGYPLRRHPSQPKYYNLDIDGAEGLCRYQARPKHPCFLPLPAHARRRAPSRHVACPGPFQ